MLQRNEAPADADVVVLVDDDGEAVGVAPRASVHGAATPRHLGFSCYVVDDRDRVLLTRRAWTKRTFPGVWTNSLCGHPRPGEPLVDAVRRRADDELGLGLRAVRLVLPAFRYRAEMAGVVEDELCPVVVAVAAGVPRPAPEEVDALEWAPWSQFRAEVLEGGRPVSPWCREQVALLPAGPPGSWPTGDPTELPPALRSTGAPPTPV